MTHLIVQRRNINIVALKDILWHGMYCMLNDLWTLGEVEVLLLPLS